jgi:hypothetical protein
MSEPPQINNRQLDFSKIPKPDAEWGKISRFALTFDGYSHWGSNERCAEIANSRRHATLTDLRTCLFFEQRRWHHFGDTPDKEAQVYIREVIDQIRRRVALANQLLA